MRARTIKSAGFRLASLALCVWLAGCVTQTGSVGSYTTLAGHRNDLMDDNRLDTPASDQPVEFVWLNAARIEKETDHPKYYLEVVYMTREEMGLLDIPLGQTLTLKLDGQPMKLAGSGSINLQGQTRKGIVKERSLYEVTLEQIKQIVAAKRVEVYVKGNKGAVLREFDSQNFKRFQDFVDAQAQ
jgi:hypothetical protein